jgi:hypothetical protein
MTDGASLLLLSFPPAFRFSKPDDESYPRKSQNQPFFLFILSNVQLMLIWPGIPSQ